MNPLNHKFPPPRERSMSSESQLTFSGRICLISFTLDNVTAQQVAAAVWRRGQIKGDENLHLDGPFYVYFSTPAPLTPLFVLLQSRSLSPSRPANFSFYSRQLIWMQITRRSSWLCGAILCLSVCGVIITRISMTVLMVAAAGQEQQVVNFIYCTF